ncbi:MAG: WYL domain-containing protein [Candidatus Tectomicrobia bacterium]|uniref:WYL domain-containing protein n=1 Tax=Tectimicrobiota bacterium TaxID=2528274 RepID=A0A938B012_UNCTE|nr:WYL domain-containing protein [Candidatus Tectomicrobia bacterium]
MGTWPSPTTSLDELAFTFVDVETTGLDPTTGDRVCEIALLRVHGRTEVARFESLVHPQRPMPSGALAVHGITDAMLADAPSFATLLPEIYALLQDAVLVAHNARFDVGFLRHEWQRAGQTFPFLAVADTLALAQARYRFRHNSLSAIAGELGVIPTALHRAMADVETTWQVWQRFIADMRQDGPVTLAQVLYPNSRHTGEALASMITALQDAIRTGDPLQLRYQPDKAATTVRTVQPLEVYYERGHGYVRAFCHLRQEERHFRLDRIGELTTLPRQEVSDC